jgi:hypothetical protein
VAAGAAGGARPLSTPPPATVLDAFGVGEATLLDGGQGQAYRAGDIVLKPVLDAAEAEWLAGLLDGLPAVDDLRVIRPAPAGDGRWVVDGWAAWCWLPGERRTLPGPALLDVSHRLHGLLRDVPLSPALTTDHPWARGHAWARGDIELDVPPAFDRIVRELRTVAGTPSADEVRQLVHGDIAGNVLVADGLPPAVIDVSLDWQPVAYADAVAIVDAVAWWDAPLDDLVLVEPHLAARAALFRLGTTAILWADEPARLQAELSAFEPVAERLRSPAP